MAITYISEGTWYKTYFYIAPYLLVFFGAHVYWDTRYFFSGETRVPHNHTDIQRIRIIYHIGLKFQFYYIDLKSKFYYFINYFSLSLNSEICLRTCIYTGIVVSYFKRHQPFYILRIKMPTTHVFCG